MENFSIDFTSLKSLVEVIEILRIKESPFFSCEKRAIVIRGWAALYKEGKIHQLDHVKIEASASSKKDKVLEKVSEDQGTSLGLSSIAVAVFKDESLNKVIEIIYGYYIKYRKTHTPFFIYRQILLEARNHGDTSLMYTKNAAKLFLKEHAQ